MPRCSARARGDARPDSTPSRICFPATLDCAQDAQVSSWEFALELGPLYAAGMRITDLRWMVAKAFVEHADETSVYGGEHRSFTPGAGLRQKLP